MRSHGGVGSVSQNTDVVTLPPHHEGPFHRLHTTAERTLAIHVHLALPSKAMVKPGAEAAPAEGAGGNGPSWCAVGVCVDVLQVMQRPNCW